MLRIILILQITLIKKSFFTAGTTSDGSATLVPLGNRAIFKEESFITSLNSLINNDKFLIFENDFNLIKDNFKFKENIILNFKAKDSSFNKALTNIKYFNFLTSAIEETSSEEPEYDFGVFDAIIGYTLPLTNFS